MPPSSVNDWLKKKQRAGIFHSAGYAVITFLGGGIFLGLTFWIVFMVAKLILLSVAGFSWWVTSASLLIAVIACAFLFFDSLNSPRDDMSSLFSWLLREYVDIGPRLLLEVPPALRTFQRWREMDLETCGRVLMFLAGRESPARKSDLLRVFPEIDWDQMRMELRLIPGVIFFQPDELRVSLTLPLRLELRVFRTRKRVPVSEAPPEPEPVRSTPPQTLTPAEILGVSMDATVAEIKAAYRRRVKECHPDRFATMDESSRAAAEEWTKSVNAAYVTLLAETRNRRPDFHS